MVPLLGRVEKRDGILRRKEDGYVHLLEKLEECKGYVLTIGQQHHFQDYYFFYFQDY